MGNIVRAFNHVADSYDSWYSHPQGRQIFETELKAINLFTPLEGIGLELGAGTGIFAEHLSHDARRIICVDPSSRMLTKAKERKLDTVLCVGENLPFRVNVIDFTYLVTVLEFLVDPVNVFKEIKDVAQPNAPLTILFINSDSSWGDLYREIGSKEDPIFQCAKLYTLYEVNTLLSYSKYFVTGKVGTLTTTPMEKKIGGELSKPGPHTGVIIIQAQPR